MKILAKAEKLEIHEITDFYEKSDFHDFDLPEPCKNKAEFSFSRSERFYEKLT